MAVAPASRPFVTAPDHSFKTSRSHLLRTLHASPRNARKHRNRTSYIVLRTWAALAASASRPFVTTSDHGFKTSHSHLLRQIPRDARKLSNRTLLIRGGIIRSAEREILNGAPRHNGRSLKRGSMRERSYPYVGLKPFTTSVLPAFRYVEVYQR